MNPDPFYFSTFKNNNWPERTRANDYLFQEAFTRLLLLCDLLTKLNFQSHKD
ncbi:hypothetical protein HMPREF1557_00709 [Streptococcus sobrinus W1703]|uniref:Uncharacterized protein n=1 Tax=Streptococcus sobrinus W1703 TaxID=1227275 RepID=U2KRY5_9STRE|nr:hypothetical protein HMPREF1557_00709 [Streptococcus sobrinus W1703]